MANPISIKDPDSRLEKTPFPKEFFISFYTIYTIYTNHNPYSNPPKEIFVPFQNGGQITDFHFFFFFFYVRAYLGINSMKLKQMA